MNVQKATHMNKDQAIEYLKHVFEFVREEDDKNERKEFEEYCKAEEQK